MCYGQSRRPQLKRESSLRWLDQEILQSGAKAPSRKTINALRKAKIQTLNNDQNDFVAERHWKLTSQFRAVHSATQGGLECQA